MPAVIKNLVWAKKEQFRHEGHAAGGLYVATIVRDETGVGVFLAVDVSYEYCGEPHLTITSAKRWAQAEWVRIVKGWVT